MKITSQMVKELRDKTNAGMMDCKKALVENDGDMEKSIDFLRLKGMSVAAKRAGRSTSEGIIQTYIHSDGKLGVMIEVGCETDFVAKTDDFISFSKDIAMQVAATNPLALTREDVSPEEVSREKEIYSQQALDSGKPANIVEKIIEGKLDKFYSEVCLLEQKFVKDPDVSIQDKLNELVAKMGENISVKKICRMQVGQK